VKTGECEKRGDGRDARGRKIRTLLKESPVQEVPENSGKAAWRGPYNRGKNRTQQELGSSSNEGGKRTSPLGEKGPLLLKEVAGIRHSLTKDGERKFWESHREEKRTSDSKKGGLF